MNKDKLTTYAFLIIVLSFLCGGIIGIKMCGLCWHPRTMIVSDCNYKEDMITLKDANGISFFYKGIDDFEVGDIVAVILADRSTETIKDDDIVSIQYCGQIKIFEKVIDK